MAKILPAINTYICHLPCNFMHDKLFFGDIQRASAKRNIHLATAQNNLVLPYITSCNLKTVAVQHSPKSGFHRTVLRFTLMITLLLALAGAAWGQETTETFTEDGTFTVPAGVTEITVEVWGAGSGGGGGNSPQPGGGGGAYARSVILNPSGTYSITVGEGGGSGTDGGNSSYGNLVIAVGGSGTTGGQANASTGQVKYSGGNGAQAPGGGGSSAGTSANGNNASGINGGIAPSGGGNGGSVPSGNNQNGENGVAPGGGGAGSSGPGKGAISGRGADGKVVITWEEPTSPTLSVSPASFDFGYVENGTISAEQSYTLTGSNLTDDVTVTPPAGFLISTTSGIGYSSSPLTITPASGSVNQTIYVVFNPTAATDYSGDITHTSTGATTQNVNVSGTAEICSYSGNSSSGITFTPCINMPSYEQNISSTLTSNQYFILNVIEGLNYEIYTCESISPAHQLRLIAYEEGNPSGPVLSDSYSNSGNPCTSASNNVYLSFTAPFSGQIRVLINRADDCNATTPDNLDIRVNVPDGNNTAENEADSGSESWIGHVYDGNSFDNYVGTITESETFYEGFGNDQNCFDVYSEGNIRAEVYTESYSARFRMTTTKTGCYLSDLTADDGIRLYVDGIKIFDRWIPQAPTDYNNVMVPLTNGSNLVYEYFENSGQNVVAFQNFRLIENNNLTGGLNQTICEGSTASQITGTANLEVDGGSLPAGITFDGWQWYYSSSSSESGTPIIGATGQNYTPSGSPFDTPGVYYVYREATVSSSNADGENNWGADNLVSCSFESDRAVVTVHESSVGGTAFSDQTICSGSSPSDLTVSGYLGDIQWQFSNDNIDFNNIAGATSETLTSSQMGTISETTYYRAEITNGICDPDYSNVVTIIVYPLPATGEIIPD